MMRPVSLLLCLLLIINVTAAQAATAAPPLVINHGRVIDPESGLDAIRHLAIADGAIITISETPLPAPEGGKSIDATGLVVAPGFIDLHQHAWTPEAYAFKIRDGVTSILELEVGTADIESWYADKENQLPLNFGVSIGHIPSRMKIMGDFPAFLPPADGGAATKIASPEQLAGLRKLMERGLKQGAPAVGFGLQYTPAAERWEILELFRLAAEYDAPCHVHMRFKGETEPGTSIEALEEVIAAAAITGAALHIVHINSTGGPSTPRMLQMISEARDRGLDITVECYPYTAGMTDISSAIFDEGFRERMGVDYGDLQWGATGERLTEGTFQKYRATGGLVIVHSNPESIVRGAVLHPVTMIASDGLAGHPRNAGTYSRILGHYSRDTGGMDLVTALRKISLWPAQRLEKRVPAMRQKGRIKIGADADLVLFDPDQVIDKATFTDASQFSEGIRHTLVHGTLVVENGEIVPGATPGQPIRAPLE